MPRVTLVRNLRDGKEQAQCQVMIRVIHKIIGCELIKL